MVGKLIKKGFIPYWVYIIIATIPHWICTILGLQYLDKFQWYYLFAIPLSLLLASWLKPDRENNKNKQSEATVNNLSRKDFYTDELFNIICAIDEEGTYNLFLWYIIASDYGNFIAFLICTSATIFVHFLLRDTTREEKIDFLIRLSINGLLRLLFGSVWASFCAHLFHNGIITLFEIIEYTSTQKTKEIIC